MANERLIPFLKKLKKNNNKEWFDKNRPEYEELRKEFILTIAEIIKKLSKTDKSIATLEAKSTLFRINKDIRFSKDKTPYKTNFGASITDGGKKSPKAGYYIHIEPGGCFIGGGIYAPAPDVLFKIRQEIDYNGKELEKILNKPIFKKTFDGFWDEEKLVRIPKGFDESSPFSEYLKLKHFVATASIDEKDFTAPKFTDQCVKIFETLFPLLCFLNTVFESEEK